MPGRCFKMFVIPSGIGVFIPAKRPLFVLEYSICIDTSLAMSKVVNDDGKNLRFAFPDSYSDVVCRNENNYGDPLTSGLLDTYLCKGEFGFKTNGKNCCLMFPGIYIRDMPHQPFHPLLLSALCHILHSHCYLLCGHGAHTMQVRCS